MAQQNTTTTLDGLFKIVYGEGPINVVPEFSYVQKQVPFKAAEKIGKTYNFPVILSQENGVTYLAAGAGVSTLNASIAATLKEATINANQIILRAQMDYEAAAKAVKSKESFKNASELLVENLMETASKRLEASFIYGQSATGILGIDSSVNASTTSTVLTCLSAQWNPGVVAGAEGTRVQFWVASTGAAAATTNDFTITAVDFTNKKITVSGTATTGIGELDTSLAADCYMTYYGAKTGTSTWAEPVGIDKIVLNTGSLFGIDAAAYAMWSGSSYGAGSAALTVAKILNAAGQAVAKGGLMEEADVLLSPKTFANLSGSMTDLRRQNGGQNEKTGIGGFENIVLMGPNGKLNIVAHAMIKEGEAFIVPMKRMKRIGSQEFSFETPGRAGELFLHIPDANAYELRLYGASQLFCTHPAKMVKISSIVNS